MKPYGITLAPAGPAPKNREGVLSLFFHGQALKQFVNCFPVIPVLSLFFHGQAA
ncbi:hypothetical protein B4135_3783 [Caldibacillus debilis]|uniref:Uncharacterized protein n=1 Tax=Caldibacillus debilis TaxID=301148 RepID=A0A150LBS2_9BACI|nr:hypothetical protein B4135_3783 [Caldibacillus debilis]